MSTGSHTLEARQLKKWFPLRESLLGSLLGRSQPDSIRAVDGVDLTIGQGEIVGLAGESGCGKSTLGLTLAGLYEPTDGQVLFRGREVGHAIGRDAAGFRRRVQIVFQDPYGSLNPRFTVRRSVLEPLLVHRIGDDENRSERVARALELAGLSPAAKYLDRFPHQLSGGERQRVSIARAIVLEPQFLIADEPVSMLDVSIRAGILKLLASYARDLGMGILYISHDLSTIRYICHRTAIMYLGKIIEIGPTETVLFDPRHPYSRALLSAVPEVEPQHRRKRVQVYGEASYAHAKQPGCSFQPRCPYAQDICRVARPELAPASSGAPAACHFRDDPGIQFTDSREGIETRFGGAGAADVEQVNRRTISV